METHTLSPVNAGFDFSYRRVKEEDGFFSGLASPMSDLNDSESAFGMPPSRQERRRALAGKLFAGGMLLLVAWSAAWVMGGLRRTDGNDGAIATCNPYEQAGVLLVNETSLADNRWEPIDAPANCQPVDYMRILRENKAAPELQFARNRTIVLLGDSVDRDHIVNFCIFAGGTLESILSNDPRSPPYPVGREVPDPARGTKWQDFVHSRPYHCWIPELDLHLVSTFHYGFRREAPWLTASPHFYPPATAEERFTQITLPLLSNLHASGVSSLPDLISVTPSFWDIMRSVLSDGEKLRQLEADGLATAEDRKALSPDAWAEISQERKEWFEGKFRMIIRTVLETWPGDRPRILWRALHQPRPFNHAPRNHVRTVDQIGRAVVRAVIAEDAAARTTGAALRRSQWGSWFDESETEGSVPLGSRLAINPWGGLMLGQERHFRDEIHPLPLPGSWLYGNILLRELRIAVEGDSGTMAR